MLETPTHITRAGIADAMLSFAWDEWSIKSYYWDVPQALFHRLNSLTDDASMALTLAIGEWVFHRFDAVNSDPTALEFLEAAWAGTIHPYYCVYTETVDDEWRGPVRGPQAVAIAIANDGLFCRNNDPEVATRACWMYMIATHVLHNTEPLEIWFREVVGRLELYYARLPSDRRPSFFGQPLVISQPVPRNAFDISKEFHVNESSKMIDAFLRNLDPTHNRFLRPAAELRNIPEFAAEPYQFY